MNVTAHGGSKGGEPVVLLVDDDALQLRCQRLHLERAGYSVLEADDAASALRAALCHRPAAILSDLLMPEVDGFQFCRMVRKRAELAQTAIVLVSGQYVDERARRHAAHCGANMFISRHEGMPAVVRAVSSALAHPAARLAPLPDLTLDAEHDACAGPLLDRTLFIDSGSGLPSRRAFRNRIERSVQASQQDNSSFALLAVRIANLAEINEVLGPDCRDQVMVRCAQRLMHVGIAAKGSCGALGADDFGVLLPVSNGSDTVYATASTLLAALSLPIEANGIPVDLCVRIGSAQFPSDALSGDELLRRASIAVRSAMDCKESYAAYRPEMDRHACESLTVASDLRAAITNGQLELWYQPKRDLATGQVTSAEALVRWRHPVRGLISPMAFIAHAERSGQIREITRWAIRTAVEHMRRWHELGRKLAIAVNVSQVDLEDPSFEGRVIETLAAAGVSPHDLTLEVTESAVMRTPELAIAKLARLRSHGVRIALDDFGAGQTSLAQLHQVPLDEIKLDQSLVRHLGEKPSSAIAAVTVMLARSFGLRAVAEGVESAEVLDKVGSLGFSQAQGFHVGKPVPAAQLLDHVVPAKAACGMTVALAAGSGY